MTSIKFRALTHDDHKLFFEALGEYGKDFQNIQQYMTQKCSKGGNKSSDQNKYADTQERREQEKKEDDKKREQIRNFYNKLYTKLAQLIGKLDDRVEKVNQELYLLINYGEIWKKHGFKFNNKTKKLLEELVHQGYTTLRFKNKNVRLRTPTCKALKKINQIGIDEKTNVVTTRELPKDVVVEFHPATNRDWLKVQSISQNPRVRARLSMQKRLSSILEFLENKWNVSHDKLNRTVDAWLKMPSSQSNDEVQQQQQQSLTPSNITNLGTEEQIINKESGLPGTPGYGSVGDCSSICPSAPEFHTRIRLKPSSQHELKEVNITRVVPDYHLDLSLNAYIKRLGLPEPPTETEISKTTNADPSIMVNAELSQGAMSSTSCLPVSLTTPDSSVLLERSITSDQYWQPQIRRGLNLLQTLAGAFEGCENSRTAEDTQDRSLGLHNDMNQSTSNHDVSIPADLEPTQGSLMVNNNIPALFDEDAAIGPMMPTLKDNPIENELHNERSEKSVDYNIPKNCTLGEFFSKGSVGGDEANDTSALVKETSDKCDHNSDFTTDLHDKSDSGDNRKAKNPDSNNSKPYNYIIEIEKLADGLSRQDSHSTMTIGELYLAFKCPEKIVLEYEFEQFTHQESPRRIDSNADLVKQRLNSDVTTDSTKVSDTQQIDDSLICKLLTVASLSLARIERQKQEQQHKLHDQPGAKLKRRKGPCNPNTFKYLKRDEGISKNATIPDGDGQGNCNPVGHIDNNNYMSANTDRGQAQVMTLRDIETTNQRVEEALKQLQPTRLSVFRRAR